MEDKAKKKKKKKKKKGSLGATIILILVFIVGISLVLYPTVSDWWNSMHMSRAIAGYAEATSKLTEEEYREIMEKAKAYNAKLLERTNLFELTDELREEYYSLLDIDHTGMIGYIDIDKIGVHLPVYHGTSHQTLQVAIGHVEWSSLPIGGESTHAVVSGHRGLPSAKLFTELDKIEIGDIFVIHYLNEEITYQVDQILTVLPEETQPMAIERGADYCTLVTCTPYGINTHRILVRGKRIDNLDHSVVAVTSDATQIKPILVAAVIAAVSVTIWVIWTTISGPKKKKSKKNKDSKEKKESKTT